MRAANQDPALFIGLLSLIATQLSRIRSGKIDDVALKLQNQAIRLQARACEDGKPDDARIMTALSIMSNHMAAGNAKEMVPHMQAIASFVSRRGGLHNLGMDGLVADNLEYADHTRAVVYNNCSNYPMVLPSLQPSAQQITPGSFLRHLGAGFYALWQANLISEPLYHAASDISFLTDIYDRAARKVVTIAETHYFSYLASVVEYQLANLNATYHDTGSLDDCLTLALLLLNHSIFRNYGQVSPIIPILESRFWHCFEKLRHDSRLVSNDLLIWLTFTGVISHVRRPCPFMEDAVKVLAEIRVEQPRLTFDTVKVLALDKYTWSATVQEHVFRQIWEQVIDKPKPVVKAEAMEEPIP